MTDTASNGPQERSQPLTPSDGEAAELEETVAGTGDAEQRDAGEDELDADDTASKEHGPETASVGMNTLSVPSFSSTATMFADVAAGSLDQASSESVQTGEEERAVPPDDSAPAFGPLRSTPYDDDDDDPQKQESVIHPGDLLADFLENGVQLNISNESVQQTLLAEASHTATVAFPAPSATAPLPELDDDELPPAEHVAEESTPADHLRSPDHLDTASSADSGAGYIIVHHDGSNNDVPGTPSSPSTHASLVDYELSGAATPFLATQSDDAARFEGRAELADAAYAYAMSGLFLGSDGHSRDFEVYGFDVPEPAVHGCQLEDPACSLPGTSATALAVPYPLVAMPIGNVSTEFPLAPPSPLPQLALDGPVELFSHRALAFDTGTVETLRSASPSIERDMYEPSIPMLATVRETVPSLDHLTSLALLDLALPQPQTAGPDGSAMSNDLARLDASASTHTSKEVRFAQTAGIPIWGPPQDRPKIVQKMHAETAVETVTISAIHRASHGESTTFEHVEAVAEQGGTSLPVVATAEEHDFLAVRDREPADDVVPGSDSEVYTVPMSRPILRIFEEPLDRAYEDDDDDDTTEEHVAAVVDSASTDSALPRTSDVHHSLAALGVARHTVTVPVVSLPAKHQLQTDYAATSRVDSATSCHCSWKESGPVEAGIAHTAPPLVRFSLSLTSNVSEPRSVAFAIVDDQSCAHTDLEVVVWKIVDVPVGPFSEIYDFTGQFGVVVHKDRSTYSARSVNRIGALTRITNRNSTIVIHNPEYVCGEGSRQMRVRNESDEPVDISIGVVTCDKVFEPLLRHRELPCDEEMVTSFRSLSLQMFFIPPGTTECSFESGQFGAVSFDSFTAAKRNMVKVEMHEKNGKFRALVQ